MGINPWHGNKGQELKGFYNAVYRECKISQVRADRLKRLDILDNGIKR